MHYELNIKLIWDLLWGNNWS